MLPLFSNLRRLHSIGEVSTSNERRPPEPWPGYTSLASMRHLTRLSLHSGGQLKVRELQLLASLPALASLLLETMHCEDGNERTLRQWRAMSAGLQLGSSLWQRKRKATEEAAGGKDKHVGEDEEREGVDNMQDDDASDASGEEDEQQREEGANEPDLAIRHSARLLFLHALAVNPCFVHLQLNHCGLIPFVMQSCSTCPCGRVCAA